MNKKKKKLARLLSLILMISMLMSNGTMAFATEIGTQDVSEVIPMAMENEMNIEENENLNDDILTFTETDSVKISQNEVKIDGEMFDTESDESKSETLIESVVEVNKTEDSYTGITIDLVIAEEDSIRVSSNKEFIVGTDPIQFRWLETGISADILEEHGISPDDGYYHTSILYPGPPAEDWEITFTAPKGKKFVSEKSPSSTQLENSITYRQIEQNFSIRTEEIQEGKPKGATNLSWSEEGYPVFTMQDGNGYSYSVRAYRNGKDITNFISNIGLWNTDPVKLRYDDFLKFYSETGEYKYAVEVVNKSTGASTVTYSQSRQYNAPGNQLQSPQNVRWVSQGRMSWDPVEGDVAYYDIDVKAVAKGYVEEEYNPDWSKFQNYGVQTPYCQYDMSRLIGEFDSQKEYRVRVRAIAPAPENAKYANGEYSDWSDDIWDSDIYVTSVNIIKSSITIPKGNSEKLDLDVQYPTDKYQEGKKPEIRWFSENESIAKVDQEGNVTAIAPGTTQVTACSVNNIYDTCNITVPKVAMSSVSLSKTIASLTVGQNIELLANVLPLNTSDEYNIHIETSEKGIVSVQPINDQNETADSASDKTIKLKVEAVNPGYTNIIVRATAGNITKTATCAVTVLAGITSIDVISPYKKLGSDASVDADVFAGTTGMLKVIENPSNAKIMGDIEWTSNHPSVVSVMGLRGTNEANFSVGTDLDFEGATTKDVVITATHTDSGKSTEYTLRVHNGIDLVWYEGATTEKAKASVKANLGKPISELDSLNTDRMGYIFTGWYTSLLEDGSIAPNSKMVTSNTVLKDQFKLYGHWEKIDESDDEKSMVVSKLGSYVYTGKAIKPTVKVYDEYTGQLLKEKIDYTLTYKNNTKVGKISDDPAKRPYVKVSPKGNFKEVFEVPFTIEAEDISGSDFTAEDIIVAYNPSKVQKAVPVLKWNGKNLKYKADGKGDFTVTYLDAENENSFKNPGVYRLLLKGTGNFTGSRVVNLTITDGGLMSKASISLIKGQNLAYNGGQEIIPEFTVKIGKNTLTEGADYVVAFENNTEVGTATAIFSGIGSYVGTKKVSFKITGKSIAKSTIKLGEDRELTAIPKQVYTGNEIEINDFDIYLSGEKLDDSKYEVSYQKNIKPGTAVMLVSGKEEYKGTSKQFKFSIGACPITDKSITVEVGNNNSKTALYSKGGSKPEVVVKFDGEALKPGVDYTVAYKNNTAVNQKTGDEWTNTEKIPEVIITGKGGYSGKTVAGKYQFEIIPKPLETEGMEITVADKPYKAQANIFKMTPTVLDTDKKKLAAADFDASKTTYNYVNQTEVGCIKTDCDNEGHETGKETRNANAEVLPTDILPSGTEIKVTIFAKERGNYSGSISGYYHIGSISISKVTVEKITKSYNGKEITLDDLLGEGSKIIQYKAGKTVEPVYLELGKDFEIIEYANNIKKGTAKMTIRGKGEYYGTKVISFTIEASPSVRPEG